MKELSEEEKNIMVNAYLSGKTAKEAANLVGYRWPDVCLRELRIRNISIRNRNDNHVHSVLSEETRNKIIELYLDGKKISEIENLLGCGHTVCSKVLKRNNIVTRSKGQRKHHINENFFDIIDTEEKAYWLGFFLGDSYVRKYRVMIQLSAKDKNHLYKLKNSIEYSGPIKERMNKRKEKYHPSAIIMLNSLKLCDSLRKFGIEQNKSFTAKIPEGIPEYLLPHFWLGMLDSDGSFILSNGTYKVQLVGTKDVCEGFRKWATEFVNSNASVRPHGKIYKISFGGNNISKKIINILYKDATIFLDRKYEKIAEILE